MLNKQPSLYFQVVDDVRVHGMPYVSGWWLCSVLLPTLTLHRFLIVFDEDHDERIVEAIDELIKTGEIHRLLAVSERKGFASIVPVAPGDDPFGGSITLKHGDDWWETTTSNSDRLSLVVDMYGLRR